MILESGLPIRESQDNIKPSNQINIKLGNMYTLYIYINIELNEYQTDINFANFRFQTTICRGLYY